MSNEDKKIDDVLDGELDDNLDAEDITNLRPIDEYRILLENRKWTNRRRMAWICLIVFLVSTYKLMFQSDPNTIEKLDPIYTWFSIFCLSVIGGYMGFATYYDMSKK